MKPGIPWSVKGIEPDLREAAKSAAKRSGMTLGEWLNAAIVEFRNAHFRIARQARERGPAELKFSSAEPLLLPGVRANQQAKHGTLHGGVVCHPRSDHACDSA